jgi:hypothetical protein
MHIVVGPVLTRKGGSPLIAGPRRGAQHWYTYGRIEDAHYARKVEIRCRKSGCSNHLIACSTVNDFMQLTI